MSGFWRSLWAGPSSLRDEACCTSSPKASVPIAKDIPPLSPARLLAASLTDPETRGEWEYCMTPSLTGGISWSHKNKTRDIEITQYVSLYSSGISTPFTLTAAEEKVVRDAVRAFDNHRNMCREAEVLNRLTAPREGLKPDRGETPKSGSTAKPRKPDPKGHAQ